MGCSFSAHYGEAVCLIGVTKQHLGRLLHQNTSLALNLSNRWTLSTAISSNGGSEDTYILVFLVGIKDEHFFFSPQWAILGNFTHINQRVFLIVDLRTLSFTVINFASSMQMHTHARIDCNRLEVSVGFPRCKAICSAPINTSNKLIIKI